MFKKLINIAMITALTAVAFATSSFAVGIMPNLANVPTGWTTDRYDPASFTNVGPFQGRANVLGIVINSTTDLANRPAGYQTTFNNTQGRQYSFSPAAGPGSMLSSDLFIPTSWNNAANGNVRTDMWAVMRDGSSAISSYPIIGFTNYGGAPRLRVWDDGLPGGEAWHDLATAINYNAWNRLSIELLADTSVKYYVNGALVYTQASTASSVAFSAVVMQAYNFADPSISGTVLAPYTANWANSTLVVDPDGQASETNCGATDAAFTTIQAAINAAAAGDTVKVCSGTYSEDVSVNKTVSIQGAGASTTTVSGPIGGPSSTFTIGASSVELSGFTITRAGNNTSDWNNPGLKTAGIAIQGLSLSNSLIHDNIITGMRTGIDVNNSNGHTFRNNVIDFNRTGLIFRNQTDNITFIENFVRNNWTVGILFIDASTGSNVPVQTSLNSTFSNNNISGNWYGEIADRQTGGSLPAPGTTNLKNFRGNWFGSTSPVTTTANTAEPGYSAQIPVLYGGSAVDPGGQPDIAGPASANFQTNPLLTSGVDTNVETVPGRGTFGFQGAPITVSGGSPGDWVFFNETPSGSGSYVVGPNTAPLGLGSARLTVDATGGHALGTMQFAGTRLADITDLRYSSFQNNASNPGPQAISIQFDVDSDLTDANIGYQGRLVFEPYQTPSNVVQQGTWHEWNAKNGRWWGSGSGATRPISNACPQANPCTLAQILAAFPNAGVHSQTATAGIFAFKAGSAWAGGFDGNVDRLIVGISGATRTIDFEPFETLVVDDDGMASSTDCNATTPANTNIAAAVAAAVPGDTIRVCPGTYVSGATLNLNKANLTILGVGPAKPVIQLASSMGTGISVSAAGVTLDNLEIQKTDLAAQTLIAVGGNNFTAKNNLIYGPDPGVTWDAAGIVSRAFVISNNPGFLLQNNVIHHLRQPAYISGSFGVPAGSIVGNQVSGTKGWVVEGGKVTFSGNTFGPPENQSCDIALLNNVSLNPLDYQPLLALSSTNGNGFICAQFPGGENGRAIAYVDSPVPSLGSGSSSSVYTTLQEGINGALTGGTVQVAAGTYTENINISKSLNVLGPNANVNPNTGTRVTEAVIRPATSNPIDPGFTGPTVVSINAAGVVFNGFTVDGDNQSITSGVVFNGVDVNAEFGIYGTDTFNSQATITNNIVRNIGEFGIWLDESQNNGPHSNSSIRYNKVDNIPGAVFGQGIRIANNAYANIQDNVVTRVGLGIVTENIGTSDAGAAPVISGNTVSAHIYGIRHNLHYGYSTNGFTISNNSISSYVESYPRANPVTRYNGIRVESIGGSVPVTISGNSITPDRTALVGNGYSRVDGIFITNTSTTSPNILITQNTVSNALRGISHTTPAVPNVTCNLLIHNVTGVYVGTDIGYGGNPSSSTNGILVNNNNIVSNSSFGLQNDSSFITNAENNYWGSVSGPGGSGPGTGNAVSSNVDFQPFLASASTCSTLPPSVTISGTITPATAGVTVSLTGDQIASTLTDGSGNYSFSGLTSGGNYLVTPSFAGSTFEPTNRSYSSVTVNVTDANFTAFTSGSPRNIAVVSQNVAPGNQVIVPITMTSQGNENSVGFSLNYDPSVLSNPVVSAGTDCSGCSLIVNNPSAGVLGVIVAKPVGQTFVVSPPARQLITVTFNTSAAPAVFSTPITFSDSPVTREVTNTNADPLPATYSSGAVTFATGFESDVAPRFGGSNTGVVTVADYTQTGRFAAGLDTVNPSFNEFQRADAAPRATRGSGSITVADYTQAGRYAAGLDPVQVAGGPSVASALALEDLQLKRTWAVPATLPRILRAVDVSTSPGQQVDVSIEINAQGDENGFGFTISYDGTKLSNPVVTTGSGLPFSAPIPNTNTAGKVGVITAWHVFGGSVPAGTLQIVKIRFNVSPTATPGATGITFTDYPPVVDEVSDALANVAPTTFTDGVVNIAGPTAGNTSVGGMLISAGGQAVGRARITLTDSFGSSRVVLSNPFGFYRFDDVQVGSTYVLSVQSKGHVFQPVTVSVNDSVTGLNLVADQ